MTGLWIVLALVPVLALVITHFMRHFLNWGEAKWGVPRQTENQVLLTGTQNLSDPGG
jgi:hypothetical protein